MCIGKGRLNELEGSSVYPDTEKGAEMLELKNIKKSYLSGLNKVHALDGVSVNFRDNEFVAILGPSGSGKTTLLNIIGGLDRYDSGDLVINSRSTKEYGDKDWDGYRNHSVGFVFQNYNLIPHQTVLANVELALTLSGVSKKDRRRKAKSVLRKVGLSDQLHKKPNQLSGGQMQRVAIARALVNDPDILLADEPTGALDSKTSVQIMELIREISKDRLVIMVTHNPKIAKEFASRIIRIKDGIIRKDSDPFEPEMYEGYVRPKKIKKAAKKDNAPRASMSLSTALSLSFNNLLTKKGRTLITSFAGSIGIIGIALILSLSNGMQTYIDSIERGALASYPITIESESFDLTQILSSASSSFNQNIAAHGKDKIYKRPMLQNSVNDFEMKMQQNDLRKFKEFIELNTETFAPLCSDIKYGYDVDLQIFKSDTTGGVSRVRPNDSLDALGLTTKTDVWEEIIGDSKMLNSQYEILAGRWPENYNELVLFLDDNNEIDDVTLYALGLADASELEQNAQTATEEQSDEPIELESYDYDEFLDLSFKILPPTAYYQKANGKWNDMSKNEAFMKKAVDSAQEIKIVAIARPRITAQSTASAGAVGYMSGLTDYVMKADNDSEIVKAQKANPKVDVFTGLKFKNSSGSASASPTASLVSMPSVEFAAKVNPTPGITYVENSFGEYEVMTEDEIYAYIDENYKGEEKDFMNEFVGLILKDILTAADKQKLTSYMDKILEGSDMDSETFIKYLKIMSKDMKLQLVSAVIISAQSQQSIKIPEKDKLQSGNSSSSASKPEKEKEKFSSSTYEENLSILGAADIGTPSSISIYPKDLEAKESLTDIIDKYNAKYLKDGKEENTISYTDYVNLVMSSVTQVIDIVTYALIAFVAISLIVSSIMIGIITYISVLERTKEIGILRSIGASKKDISRVFNSETIIVGLTSGVIGVLMTVLLNIPINLIVKALAGIPKLASLPLMGAVALVVISVVLTLVAGFIPARVAAKRDPVVALRSE